MGRVVYDSDHGRICPRCAAPVDACRCRDAAAPPPGDGVVRVRREVRRGKPVTVVTGLPLGAAELRAVAKELKQTCGAGGSVKDGAVELQGDRRDVVVPWLQARGHTVKLAGG